jgi:hypothetical protein
MQDVNGGNVHVRFTSNADAVMEYNVLTADNTVLETNQVFTLKPYVHHSFARVGNSGTLKLQQLGNNSHIQNLPSGAIWAAFDGCKVQGSSVNRASIKVYVVSQVTKGFLWNELYPNDIATRFSLADIDANRIHFVPYNKDNLDNENVDVRFVYDGTMSPLYTLTIKNYVSRFTKVAVNPTLRYPIAPVVNFPRSKGLISDNVQWSPTSVSLPFQGHVPWTPITPTMQLGSLYQGNWTLVPYARSDPATWRNLGPVRLIVDQSDRVSLQSILSFAQFTETKLQNVWFYISKNAEFGVVQNVVSKQSIVKFTDLELLQNQVFYQHIGSAASTTDSFKVTVSSSPYDVDMQDLQVIITVRLLPRITANANTYVYYNTTTEALAGKNMFASNLDLSYGYAHVIGANYLSTKNNDVEVQTLTATSIASNQAYFQIKPSLFATPRNAPYPRLSLSLTPNNHDEMHYNPLVDVNPVYRDLFVIPFDAYLNSYISSNEISAKQSRYQTLRYELDPSKTGYSNLKDHVFSYYLQVQPTQDLLPADFRQTIGGDNFKFLRTYDFDVVFTDQNNSNLLGMSFSNDIIKFKTPSCNLVLPYPPSLEYAFGQWDNFLFVNQDPDNNLCTSLYLQYDVTKSRQTNAPKNLLSDLNVPYVNLEALKTVEVKVDMESTRNYLGPSYRSVRSLGTSSTSLQASYDLTNYATALNFKNQEIYISTYSPSASKVDSVEQIKSSTVHNVVLGKNIIVRGTNNICVGNRFNTSGQNSIILGNDIGTGTSEGQINDIYQSIIIGNDSFRNSIVRDIISIGNDNLNSLYLSPVKLVTDFLSQKPILIGNNIKEDVLDFHVNIGNVFLKTHMGGDQVYLGRKKEVVCIGYSSNMLFNTEYMLRVNGAAEMNAVSTNIVTVPFYSTTSITSGSIVSATGAFIEGHMDFPVVVASASPLDTCVVGVCVSCTLVGTFYKVHVQTMGRAMLNVVPPVTIGSMLATTSQNELVAQGDNIRYSYTVAKCLKTVPNAGASQYVPCLLLLN